MDNKRRRLPAEWEEQDGVLLAWPHLQSDWSPYLDRVEPVFEEIATQISRHEFVVVVAPDPDTVIFKLNKAGAVMERIRAYALDTNDTWARDFGPITVFEDGKPLLLDLVSTAGDLNFRHILIILSPGTFTRPACSIQLR